MLDNFLNFLGNILSIKHFLGWYEIFFCLAICVGIFFLGHLCCMISFSVVTALQEIFFSILPTPPPSKIKWSTPYSFTIQRSGKTIKVHACTTSLMHHGPIISASNVSKWHQHEMKHFADFLQPFCSVFAAFLIIYFWEAECSTLATTFFEKV